MQILSKEETFLNKIRLHREIKKGKIILHPTDTIYGLGCSAKNKKAIEKIRKIKNDFERPFSIIAPSKSWIKENCVLSKRDNEWLDKLPGPYTLILRLKNKEAVSEEVNNDIATVGVRIPDHWIADFVNEVGIPFVSTAATLEGNELLQHPKESSDDYHVHVHYAFDDGYLKGRPSTIVDLVKDKPLVTRRD